MLRASAAPFVALLGLACAVSCTELPTIEAAPTAVDGGGVDTGGLPDAAAPDGSSVDPVPDAGPANCAEPRGYTVDCTTGKNGCTAVSLATNVTHAGQALFYPHGLALSGDGWLYFAIQKQTENGRNGSDIGAIFRTPAPLRTTGAKIEAITGIRSSPRAIAFGFGYVYWAEGPAVYRMRHPTVACGASCTDPTPVATFQGSVTALAIRSPTEIFVAAKGLYLLDTSGTASSVTTLSGVDGRLSGLPGGTAYYATSSSVQAFAPAEAPRDVAPAPGGVSDLDVAAACNDVVPFSTNKGNAYRIVGGGASLLGCTGIPCSLLTFDGALDATSAYFAVPNGPGLFRLPRLASGTPVKLVGGDLWDVAVDESTVYATDINGAKIVSISKK